MKRDRWIALAFLLAPVLARAEQEIPAGQPDSLRLGDLQQSALTSDPRQRQFRLLARQTQLRLRNLTVQRLPSITAVGQAFYQSDVFKVPVSGTGIPTPSNEMYDARLSIEQPIMEPTIRPKREVERAHLAESEAQVRADLFSLREEVNEAFFSAALLEERNGIIAATIADLEHQLEETGKRVREGAALPSDTAAIQATVLQRRQDQVEIGASRRAALARLAQLTGQAIKESDHLLLPDLAGQAAQARGGLAELRARPEYEVFLRSRERLSREEGVAAAARAPELSAFARVGYGRPGLSPINDHFDSYWIAGLQLRWEPWNWGSTGREKQTLVLEREIVAADEAAFTQSLTRSIQEDLATIDRLDSTLAMDQEIIGLREQVERETRPRYEEGVVTASEYLDRTTDVLEARLAQATHRVQLAQARAQFLTILGLEIR